ncbi:diguanylate phosphodiesterase [Magnetovibrio blakemorei]|uniref:Diguanylate phosphodiesterase n=2 Tax=Magnetovibrio blakemorei TaxID=28181 RepID=A0A1E5Q521_9PROT|nr:diguanylate phosphodiesterase [Magnetovibrio blakemorei]
MTLLSSEPPLDFRPLGCKECLEGKPLGFDITMAYQPIIDPHTKTVFAYEALVRGKDGAGAGEVLSRVTDTNRYIFDQTCRVTAIQIAARLGIECNLSINFLPNAVYRPETCIRATIEAADQFGLPVNRIIFEVTEAEPINDPAHLQNIFDEYRDRGFITAIDDFGSGYAGLNLLTKFKPQILKLDMELCQGIATDVIKRTITHGAIETAHALGIKVIAEGVEEQGDLDMLRELNVDYFQGYILCKPKTEALPEPDYSAL